MPRLGVAVLLTLLTFGGGVSGASIEVYFSPNGGAESAILRAIAEAEESIDIAMYSFTNNNIERALREAVGRGIRIRIVADEAQETTHSSIVPGLSCWVAVRYDNFSGLMHNKYGLFDGRRLITGSYNWTEGAEKRNAENLLVIDDPEIAALFAEDFAILWSTKSIHAPEPDRDQCGPVISEPPTALTPLLVNINTATETELQALDGIGPALAARIVAYREEHGPFSSVDELTRVNGIGPSILERNRDRLEI